MRSEQWADGSTKPSRSGATAAMNASFCLLRLGLATAVDGLLATRHFPRDGVGTPGCSGSPSTLRSASPRTETLILSNVLRAVMVLEEQ
jgi:hypothetical protein